VRTLISKVDLPFPILIRISVRLLLLDCQTTKTINGFPGTQTNRYAKVRLLNVSVCKHVKQETLKNVGLISNGRQSTTRLGIGLRKLFECL